MFADVTIPEKAVDPAAWAPLVEKIGVGGFFGVVILIGASLASCYILRACFGEKGFVREFVLGVKDAVVKFLANLQDSVARLEQRATATSEADQRQAQHATNLREAGMHAAAALQAIGEAVDADVTPHTEAIQQALARQPGA